MPSVMLSAAENSRTPKHKKYYFIQRAYSVVEKDDLCTKWDNNQMSVVGQCGYGIEYLGGTLERSWTWEDFFYYFNFILHFE